VEEETDQISELKQLAAEYRKDARKK